MTKPSNDNFLRAIARAPVDRTPIWLMRQAGRYLPEYRQTRKGAGDFMSLCKTPSLACEVTLQPLSRFDLDAAILFSDILTIPDAMGLGLYFVEGQGPKFERPLRNEADILALKAPDPYDDLRYVMDATSEIRRALKNTVPLIGFSGSPYTLACYMIEGGSSKDFARARQMLYQHPDLMHHLLSILADSVIAYLNAQIDSGVQAVMLFDSWGGTLSTPGYREFSLNYLKRIISGLTKQKDGEAVPSIVFTKGGGQWLEEIAAIGCDAVSIDWQTDMGEAKARIGDKVALQGNLDPAILLSNPGEITRQTENILRVFGEQKSGHVFNLGHGILPQTPVENVAHLVDVVHNSKDL